MKRQFQKLPFLRGVKILRKTARAVGKVADGFRMAGSAPSQPLVTEAKAQVASMTGAGAGSILYDNVSKCCNRYQCCN